MAANQPRDVDGQFAKVSYGEYNEAMDKLTGTVERMPVAMGEVALLLDQFVRNTFRTQTDPWGVPWPALSPVTLEQRERRGSRNVQKLIDPTLGPPIMFDTIRPDHDDTSAWLTIGEGLPDPRAPVQQWGNPENRAWGGPIAPIPPRPMIPSRMPDEVEFPQIWLDRIFAPIMAAINKVVT